MVKSGLEGCITKPEIAKLRDKYIQEVYSNNKILSSIYNKSKDKFWKLFEEYAQKNLFRFEDRDLSYLDDFYELVQKKTDFIKGGGEYSVSIYNQYGFDSWHVNNTAIKLGAEFCFKKEIGIKLKELMKKNSELLANLCKIDLEARLGKHFKGVYPYSGLDIDTPYSIGGEWLLIEPSYIQEGGTAYDFKKRIEEDTVFGKKVLEEGKVKITHSPILEQKTLSEDIKSFIPDVILIKKPTPGAEYKDVVSFYEKFVSKDTLVIADKKLESHNMVPIKNLVGMKRIEILESEMPIISSGLPNYPLTRFRMYILKP